MKKFLPLIFLLATASAAPNSPASFTFNFKNLDGLPKVVATIPDDALYRRELLVEGYPLEAVLRQGFPNLLEYAQAGYLATFRRAGHDSATVKLSDLIGGGGVLGVTDYEAAGGGRVWMPVESGGKTLRTPQIGYDLV
ncbi:hypothetical protein HLB42_20385 (plasmid) [Deinococcus sp. D7000]|nr:hypothetical protein HLB42_20385 [Deinococcus sp. D7000]